MKIRPFQIAAGIGNVLLDRAIRARTQGLETEIHALHRSLTALEARVRDLERGE